MPESVGTWEPSPELAELLFANFDGDPADPDDVISEGLDGGYRERSERLAAILRDHEEDPAGRFLACIALTRWAEPAGYAAVVEAATTPDRVAWRGASYDRFHSQDDTFALLGEAVGDSGDMVDEQGTADERVSAARALLGIADRVQFDRRISSLLRRELVVACLPEIRAVVDRGIAALTAHRRLSFDLGLQLAIVVTAVRPLDAPWAEQVAQRLTDAKPGERALQELRTA
jgi:hypothetical protein